MPPVTGGGCYHRRMAGDTKRVQVQARLRPELVARLDAEADRRLVSRTRLIEGAVERLLADADLDDR